MKQDKLKFDLQFFSEDQTDNEEETIDPTEHQDEEAEQTTLDELQEDLDEANSRVNELTNQVAELQNNYNALVEKIKAIATELGVAPEAESETSESTEDINALEDRIAGLQASNDALTAENQALTAQIAELKAAALQNLVEQVVNLKLQLGDITEEDVENETQRLIARTEQSLRDTLDDLSHRKPVTSRVIEKISNPGLADNSQNGVEVIENSDGEKKPPVIDKENLTPKDVFKGLMTKKGVPQIKRGGK
jgi:chromosome segregation ATPase